MTSYNETTIQQYWNDNLIFVKSNDKKKDKPIFVFYDGPPFATGLPHYGHILAGFIKDTIGRFQTQNGFYVPRIAGWDCHGLPIEYEIEKEHQIRTRQQIEDWGIDNYNNACKNIVMKYSSEWKNIMNRLGRWVDFDNDYKTMDFDFMNSVWWVFSELHKKGLVYPSYKALPYSVACKTPLSNFETQENYKEVYDITIFVKFELENYKYNDNLVNLLVWTSTPWTLPSNLLIAINKNIEYVLAENNNEYYIIAHNLVEKLNEQNKKNKLKIIELILIDNLIGQKYKSLFNCYPINQLYKPELAYTIIHGEFVTDSNGTGLVHIAPSYGDDDYQLCIKTQIILKTDRLFMSIDDDGYFKNLPNLPELNGIFYKNKELDGNNMIIDRLKQTKRLFFQNRPKRSYPYCPRSDTPLMYRIIESWFVNVESIKDRMVELNKTINWFPKFVGQKRFHEWLLDAKDWCIARNRYWGTPLPIWLNINDPSDYIIINSAQELSDLTKENITDLHRDKIDHLLIQKDGKTYKRTTETFDCWFESGSMPYASIGYPYKQNNLIMPAHFIAEGIDQTRGWFYTLLVISTALFNKVPFQNVIVNGHIMVFDSDTKKKVKMSKRLKNYPDPLNIVNEYGSDALRLYLLKSQASRSGSELIFSEEEVKNVVKEVIIKINNSLKFLLEWEYIISLKDLTINLHNIDNYTTNNPLDAYAIKYIGSTVDKIKLYLNSYDISRAIDMIYHFAETLSNQFIKFNRKSLKGKNDNDTWINSISTLHILLEYFAIVSAPLIPFFAEHLFEKLNKTDILSVHLTEYKDFKLPTLNNDQNKMADEMLHILEIISLVNKVRSKNGLNMKTPIKEIIIESTDEIINIIDKYNNFILDELNVLNYITKSFDISNINITIKPNYNIIKQKYINKIEIIESELKNLKNDQKHQLFCGKSINLVDEIDIDSEMCNIIVEPIKIESYYSEYIYANNTNYSVYVNKTIDDDELALGYAKKIASIYQKMRRDAKLHQWNTIRLGYQGDLSYDIENEKLIDVIYTTCGYKPEKMLNINEDQIIFKLELTNNITLYLLNP